MKSKNKKVSIIIPTFNREEFLSKALKSVLNQTYNNFEIIIIDDGSRDQTSKVVSNYQDQYPETIWYYYQENKGPAAARNFGVKKANGEYIAFLDSDDIWEPGKLESQIDFLDNNKDFGGVFSNYYFIRSENDKSEKSFFESSLLLDRLLYVYSIGEYLSSNKMIDRFIFQNFIHPSSLLIRKRIISELDGFNENLRYCEIWLYFFELLLIARFAFTERTFVGSGRHEKNTEFFIDYEDRFNFIIKAIKGTKRFNLKLKYKWLLNKKMSENYYDFGYYLKNKGKIFHAIKFYILSICFFPFNTKAWKSLMGLMIPKKLYFFKKF